MATRPASKPQTYDRTYRWKNNSKRAHLVGRHCRVIAHGTTMHSVLLEFEDGERVITSRRATTKRRKR
jgi:hypothetical protein